MSAVASDLRADARPPQPPLREVPPPRRAPAPARRASRVRPRVVVALVSLALVLAGLAWLVVELGRHPIDSVRIAAEFRHLERGDLESVVQPHLGESFFGVDVVAVREAARALPWVREASVRRVWPGSIHIAIVERVAAFRWAGDGLLEADGTLFTPRRRDGFEHLPLLEGPAGSEAEVRARFAEFRALLEPVGLRLRELALSARGAWQATLDNEVVLVFGREDDLAPMRRFVRAYPAALSARIDEVEAVDLRYANGFSVRWKRAAAEAGQG